MRSEMPDSTSSAVPCRACGRPAVDRFTRGGFRIRRCDVCDLEFVHPIPSPEELAAFYQSGYFTGPGAGYADYFGAERRSNLRKTAGRLGVLQGLGLSRRPGISTSRRSISGTSREEPVRAARGDHRRCAARRERVAARLASLRGRARHRQTGGRAVRGPGTSPGAWFGEDGRRLAGGARGLGGDIRASAYGVRARAALSAGVKMPRAAGARPRAAVRRSVRRSASW